MPTFWTCATIALLATSITALPSPEPCISRYPKAKHTLPLYRTSKPAEGNFEADITVGSQTLRAIMDTGSSDTWFLPQNYQCLNQTTLQPMPSDQCGYNSTKLIPDASFVEMNEHMNLSYGIGYSLYAVDEYHRISLGGVHVPKQNIGLVEWAAASYPGKASGLVGLAYPALTKAFPGDDPSKDVQCNLSIGADITDCNQKPYSPLLSTIFADRLTPSVFSFALSRSDSSGGLMTIGGIPDLQDPQVNVTKGAAEATVPIEKLKGIKDYTYYMASVGGFQYTGAPKGTGKGQYVVDTGTIQTIIDKENADRFIALFDPPGYKDDTYGYIVNCSATAPDLAVEIGGQTFNFHPPDLILKSDADPTGTLCVSGVQASVSVGKFPPILGSAFLRSVLAVFDVGKTEITFASRVHYKE